MTESDTQSGSESENTLSERELLIAKKAARLAVQELTDNFYKDVGRTVIQKILIIVGALAVGYAAATGKVKLG